MRPPGGRTLCNFDSIRSLFGRKLQEDQSRLTAEVEALRAENAHSESGPAPPTVDQTENNALLLEIEKLKTENQVRMS